MKKERNNLQPLKTVEWNKKAGFLQKEDQVALVLGETFLRVGIEYYQILDTIVKNNILISSLEECFDDKEDYKTIMELIGQLLECHILQQENDTDRECEKKIEEVTLVLTNRCNLSCIHCSQNADIVEKNVRELTTQEWDTVIDRVVASDIRDIVISGGEPMVRSDFFGIISYLRERSKGELTLMTNALLIHEKNVKEIVRCFDYVCISMDGGSEELTEKIRGKGVFQKVIEKIHLLQKNGFNNISLSAILPASKEAEEEFEQLCNRLSVEPSVRFLGYLGRAKTNWDRINQIHKEYICKKNYSSYDLDESLALGSLESCGSCERVLTIDEKGDVYPCNLMQKKTYCLGNILENDKILKLVSDSTVAKKIERLKAMEEGKKCRECEINKWCWSCLSELDVFEEDAKRYERWCALRKKRVYEYFFGEEKKWE